MYPAILRLATAAALAGDTLACAPGGESALESRAATAGFCSNVPRSQLPGGGVEFVFDGFTILLRRDQL